MAAVSDEPFAYVRRLPAERLPPPLAATGALGWLRANLFSSPANIALTLLCVLFIAWAIPPLVGRAPRQPVPMPKGQLRTGIFSWLVQMMR